MQRPHGVTRRELVGDGCTAASRTDDMRFSWLAPLRSFRSGLSRLNFGNYVDQPYPPACKRKAPTRKPLGTSTHIQPKATTAQASHGLCLDVGPRPDRRNRSGACSYSICGPRSGARFRGSWR